MRTRNLLKRFWTAAIAALVLLGSGGRVYAAPAGSLLQILTDGGEIVSYIECESGVASAEAQAAQYPCGSVEVTAPENIAVHTVIMLDNSLSITELNRAKIKEILEQYVQNLPENEVVSLATFGEDMQFLTEKSGDIGELTGLIESIEFHDQDTYLTDFLYQAVEKIEKDPEYTRFIVISDGVDNKAIGITKEELTDKLKETSRPIYAIGHKYGENSEQLKNMFALSRITNGQEKLIEDFEDVHQIAEEIHDFSNVYSLRMEIPQDVMDGGRRNVLLDIHTEGGDLELTGEVSMPFGLVEEEPQATPQPTPEPTPQPAPEPTLQPEPAPEPEPAKEAPGVDPVKIAGLAILILAVAGLLIYQKKSGDKNKNKKPEKKKAEIPPKPVSPQPIAADRPAGDETVVLDGRYLLVLRDRSNPERIFRYPMDQHIVVGRNIDKVQIAIDYSRTISGQHCEFYVKGGRFFIRDMGSANHTYLGGRMIDGEAEITSGSIVRLGEVEFGVEIMPI